MSWNPDGFKRIWDRVDIAQYLENFDFVLVQETWCESDIDLRNLEDKLVGFKCFTESATRVSKHGRPSGGIVVYYKEKYSKFVKRVDTGFKYGITLEIQGVNPSENLLMICAYLPPENSTAYQNETDGIIILHEKLIDLKSRYPDHKLILAGDLNARIGSLQDFILDDGVDHIPGMGWYESDNFDIPRYAKDTVVNNFGRSLIDVCTELDLHVLNGRVHGDSPGQYTNITENGCSTVDYILVESSLYSKVQQFEVHALAESNHMPVQCILDFNIKTDDIFSIVNNDTQGSSLPQQCRFKWKTELRGHFMDKLRDDTSTADLRKVQELSTVEVDEAIKVFESVLHRAAEPMEITSSQNRKKRLQPKWWDKDCDVLKVLKYNALKQFKMSNSVEDLNVYRDARKSFKNHCNRTKNAWKDGLRQKLIDCKSDSQQFWKTLKSINTKQLHPPSASPQEWFSYFERLLNQEVHINVEFADLVENFTAQHDTDCNVCAGHQNGDEITQELNSLITSEEIVNCIRNMSKGKSGGIDGIIIEMLKCSLHITEPYLRHLYNVILDTGKYPEQWTKAVLVPLHKSGSTAELNNYRGIALLSVLGKFFSKIVNTRLVEWAENTGVQKEEQAGFRKGYSTIDNIFILQSLVQKYCSKNSGRFYVLYVDFSKAFDTIPHALLFYQLMSKGVHGKVLKVLRSMYSSLHSCVRTPTGLTDFFKCERGTRQGCMLSPFLFSLYVGELVTMFEEAGCMGVHVNESAPNIVSLLFADDLITGADTVGRLQQMINVIDLFCQKWGLTVNLLKTKVMVFRNGGPLRSNEKWYFNGKLLEVVNAYKYLGTMFSPKLVWTLCQKTLAAQAKKGLYLLRKYNYACNNLPIDVQFELFDSMIAPILLYSAEVWGFCKTEHIERVHTGFCRYVLGVPSHTPTAAVLAETGRYPMYVHYHRRCVKFWLKLLSMPDTRYPKACYNMLLSLDQVGRNTWAGSVRQLLCTYGFQDVWEAQSVENINVFLREFTNRVKSAYDSEWEHTVAQSSKLTLFRSLKPDGIVRESYLRNVTLKVYRSGLTKFRCSAHELRIEKGRHSNELLADRVCRLCLKHTGNYVLEDEFHFLMCCPLYENLRGQYLFELTAGQKSYEAFLTLLCDESENSQLNLASFIYQAYKVRRTLLQDL